MQQVHIWNFDLQFLYKIIGKIKIIANFDKNKNLLLVRELNPGLPGESRVS
jgi:hypothetical protein